MTFDGSQESPEAQDQAPEVDPQEQAPETTAPEAPPENPFWGEVEKVTGPNVFRLIQPHLTKADTEARTRIEQINSQYAPWKAFADQGIEPGHVEQALGVVKRFNDPNEQVAIYESLRSFLEREGRLPDQQELQQEVQANEDEETPDPREAELEALREQLGQVTEFLTTQQQTQLRQAADQEADTWVSSEVDKLKASGLEEPDIQEVIRRAAFLSQQGVPDDKVFQQAAAEFNGLRERIRTAPRPSDSAPRIPAGPGGATPSGGSVDVSSMTKQERQAMVAQRLAAGKQS